MLNKKLIGLLIMIMLITLVNAVEIPVYEKATDITLSVPCTINGYGCSAGTNCTGTIINPSQTVLKNDESMSKNGAVYELTLNTTESDEVGLYEFTISCTNGARDRTRYLQFEITPNGERATTGKGILYFGLLIVLIIIFILDIFALFNNDVISWKSFFFLFGYLILIAISFIAWNIGQDFLVSSPFLVEMFRIIFLVLMYGFFPLLMVTFAYIILMVIKTKELEALVERGISMDEINDRIKARKRKKRRW